MSTNIEESKNTKKEKSVTGKYPIEMKLYARMLYLLVDKNTNKRQFTYQEIHDKLKERFGNAPSLVSIGNWTGEWEDELQLRESILGKDSELLRYKSDTKKLIDRDVIIKAVFDHLKTGLVYHSRRMQRYSELEDKYLSSCLETSISSSSTKKLLETLLKDNPEAKRLNRILTNFKLPDIQRGVVDSNKSFITHLEKLEKWMGAEEDKVKGRVIEASSDDIWEFEPVDIEEFLEGDEFLGEYIYSTLFECVKEDIKAIFYGNPRKILEKRRFKEIMFKEAFGTGKSVAFSQQVVDAITGKVSTIGELVNKGVKSFDTWGLNPDTLLIDKIKVTDVLKTGTGVLYKMKLSSGRCIEATANHQFYSDKGWKQLQDFGVKDFIAIPRELGDTRNKTDLTDDDVYLIGCYLSDGSFRARCTFTKPSNLKLMKKVVTIFKKKGIDCYRSNKNGVWATVAPYTGVYDYFTGIGLDSQFNLYSHEKFIPDSIMRLSNEKLLIFVNAMLNTDGWLEVRTNNAKNKSPQVSLGYCSTSEFMIDQLMIIFQRLGFVARKRMKIPKIKEKEYRKAYEINLWGKQAYELLKAIGLLLGKEELYNKAISVCEGIKWNANVDLVPFTHDDTLVYNRKQNKYKYRDFKRMYDVKKGVFYSRDKLKRLRNDFQDESLSKLADSGIFWDRVESIERLPGVHDVYDCVVDSHHHNFIANGIITHNSIRAALIACYLVYLILCLKNPAKYFDLMPSSKITITNVAVTKKQAKDVVFFKLKSMIDYCPWFRNKGYMYDPNNKLELRFDPADATRIDPTKIYKNVYITFGSSSEFSAVGYDVFCAIIDEATAYGIEGGVDKAEIIYDTFKGRVASRFAKSGMIVMAGNPHHVDDFLERRLKEAKGDKEIYMVRQRSLWEAKMPDYDGDWFYFNYDKMKVVDEIERDKQHVLRIPVVFQKEFEISPEKSTRNLAGIALESISRFITNVDKVDDMFVNSGRRNPVEILEDGTVKFDKKFGPVNDGLHAVHVDIGVTDNACGIALGHVSDFEKGNPIFYIDCLIRLKGSKTNPNILDDIRSIIYQLSKLGFNIGPVSLDGYQSTDFIQIMNRKGYDAYLLSVDLKMTPYINMRQALYEERINCPVHDFLEHELKTLENINDKKIDHPLKGSKDMSDALCGTINSLIEKVPIESVSSDAESNKKAAKVEEEEKVTRTASEIYESKMREMEERTDYGNIC